MDLALGAALQQEIDVCLTGPQATPRAGLLENPRSSLLELPRSVKWTATKTTLADDNPGFGSANLYNSPTLSPSTPPTTNTPPPPRTNSVITESSPVSPCSPPTPPTPSHKPQRPQAVTKAMSRRIASLPTSRRGAPLSGAALPQYIARQESLSTDSTGSQDSILTQTPGPYYMAPSTYQQEQYYVSAQQQQQIGSALPFATPDMNSSSTFQSMGTLASRSLNPNSAPFGPSQNDYHSDNNAPGYGLPTNSGYDTRSARGSYQQGGVQMGHAPFYPAPNPYEQGMGAVQAGSNGGQYPPASYDVAPTSNPYGHFGQAGGMNEYNPYLVPEADYSSATSNQGYETNAYAFGNGATYSPQGQVWANQYQRQAQYSAPAPQPPYVNPSNANRGKSSYSNSKLNVAAQAYNPSSNLATAPVHTINPGYHAELDNNEVHLGGPVQPPSKLPSRVNSTSPRSKASTRRSSEQPSSSIPSVSDEKSSVVGSPTPVARLPQEFSSEPRYAKTPTLRSRRGQSVIPSTDPSHKQAMQSWLESVTETSNGQGMGEKLKSPPPRMMNLLKSGGVDPTTLTPIKEGRATDADPFTGPRLTPVRLASNPFAPTHTLLGPYMGPGPLLPLPTQSGALRRLIQDGKPSVSEALESINLPFVEYCRLAREDTWGVIKIKNIPYSVNRPEVLAFLGRNARIISEQDFEPVHIVMERVTSKTLDCYVEFVNFNEAVNAVNRFETNRNGGRGGRLGQRHVEVELSSQEQLMKDLFPKAKNVTWSGSRPIIKPRNMKDPYNSGFQGFISKEELVMLVKHVEAPQRSPFSKDCPQRPFECLISTLLKYPWYMVDYITIEDRNLLHKVTLHLINLLQDRIANEHENINLTPMLLKRVWRAALKCPGFSPAMKDDVAWKCGVDDQFASELGVPTYAPFWKDLWTVGPKPGAPIDLILYYAALIREAIGIKPEMTLAQKAAKGHISELPSLFGELPKLIDLPKNRDDFETLTLAQCAAAEWAAIEQALRRALTPALTAGTSAK